MILLPLPRIPVLHEFDMTGFIFPSSAYSVQVHWIFQPILR